MINDFNDLKLYIKEDMTASEVNKKKVIISYFLGGCEIIRFQINLRVMEHFYNTNKKLLYLVSKWFFRRKKIRLGIEIEKNIFGYGLWIVHTSGIVVNPKARIGNYCRIHQNTTIGNNGHNNEAPVIGDYCFIGANSCILGDIKLGNNITIGAGSVVTKSFADNLVIMGVPACEKGIKNI